MTVIAWYDTETTELNHVTGDICQFASIVHRCGEDLDKALVFETLCNPGITITEDSKAIHGISDEMVSGKPRSADIVREWYQEVLDFAAGDRVILGGHNTTFDLNFIAKHVPNPLGTGESILPLCTMRVARRLDPLADSHKLEYLYRDRYGLQSSRTGKAHDALCDVWMCVELMEHWIGQGLFPDMWTLAQELQNPVVLEVMPFGKNKGMPFHALTGKYLNWIVKQGTAMDMDVLYTARKVLGYV